MAGGGAVGVLAIWFGLPLVSYRGMGAHIWRLTAWGAERRTSDDRDWRWTGGKQWGYFLRVHPTMPVLLGVGNPAFFAAHQAFFVWLMWQEWQRISRFSRRLS